MRYTLNLEQMESRWIAHAVDVLGCYAEEDMREGAIAAAAHAIAEHRAWLRAHGGEASDEPIETQVDEVIREWFSSPDNSVHAFFNSDRAPLTGPEIADALLLLDWNRADLLSSLHGLRPEELAYEVEKDWSINNILLHIGGSEWWYMDRLHLAFRRADRPDEPMALITKVRS
jgi:hypothetical protein